MAYQVSAGSLLNTIFQYGGYAVTTRKNVTTTNKSAKSAREDSEELRKAIRGLSDYDETKTTDTVLKNRLNSFVDSYNNLCSDGADVNSTSFEKSLKKLKECVTDHVSDLKKIGITFNSKSELTFDEDKFKKSTTDQRKKVFGDSDSFIGQVQKLARDTYRKTERQVSYTEAKDLTVSIMLSDEEMQQALGTHCLSVGVDYMSSVRDRALSSNEELASAMSYMYEQYDHYLKGGTSQENYYSDLIKKLQTSETVKNHYSQLGITFSDDGTMQYDEAVIGSEGHDVTDAATVSAYDALFADDADYKNLMNNYCGKSFYALVGASTSGITINEYA